MFNRILLPLDGSKLAECTVSHALALVELTDAELVLLHVVEENHTSVGVDPMEWHLRKVAAQTYIDDICARFQANGVEVQCLLLAGKPYERIADQVAKLDIDLVLISSHGKSGRTERPFGQVANEILENIGTSLMLIHAHWHPGEDVAFVPTRYKTILAPLDGSQRAECILPIADRLASDKNTGLVLAHVIQRPGILNWAMLPKDARTLAEELIAHTESMAQHYLEEIHLHHNDHPTLTITQGNNVAIELNHIVEQHEIGLLIICAHGAACNPVRSIGDTVEGVLAYCQCPILIYQDQPMTRASEPEADLIRERIEGHLDYSSPTG